ncbi:MAG: threonylcarbamoyl-AMP synthase [Clostridiales bacterium]|jgi:L-threonylcarbamoyladenylate synthase|nr:threonylcarbamoyl-AMP synthase [Clostridiales bacterium]
MKTKIFRGNIDFSIPGAMIREGKLVAFPTETVYGLGANGLDEGAVARIFAAKGRPGDNPLILHVADFDGLLRLTDLEGGYEERLRRISGIMPGPLTVIVKKKDEIPGIVTAGRDTVAIRIPDNNIAIELIKAAGVPIAAPSANISGRPSSTCAEHVLHDFDGKIDAIIDGGSCKVGVESTILDLTCEVPTVLRLGGISVHTLEKALGERIIVADGNGGEQTPKAPGMKYRHYAPRAPLYIIEGDFENEVEKWRVSGVKVGSLPAMKDTGKYAEKLFFWLREFDNRGVDVILAEKVDEEGIGAAIMSRLRKAAVKTAEDEGG